MKKIFLLALLASCSARITYIPERSTFYGLDFTRFSDKGFLITPEKYLNEYQSVGLITYTYLPEANYVATGRIEYEGGGTSLTKAWIFNNKMNVNSGLDTLYIFCKNMGADALMNFKVTPV